MTLKLHSTATMININEPLEHHKYIINTGILYSIFYSGNVSSASTAVFIHCCQKFLCRTRSYSRFPLPVAPGLTQGPCSLLPRPKSLLFPASSDPCSLLHLVSLRVPATYCSFSSSSMASNCKNTKYHPNQPCSKCFLCGKYPALFCLTMLLGGRMKNSFFETIVRMSQSLVPGSSKRGKTHSPSTVLAQIEQA